MWSIRRAKPKCRTLSCISNRFPTASRDLFIKYSSLKTSYHGPVWKIHIHRFSASAVCLEKLKSETKDDIYTDSDFDTSPLSTLESELFKQVQEILSFYDEIENSQLRRRWNREYGYAKRNALAARRPPQVEGTFQEDLSDFFKNLSDEFGDTKIEEPRFRQAKEKSEASNAILVEEPMDIIGEDRAMIPFIVPIADATWTETQLFEDPVDEHTDDIEESPLDSTSISSTHMDSRIAFSGENEWEDVLAMTEDEHDGTAVNLPVSSQNETQHSHSNFASINLSKVEDNTRELAFQERKNAYQVINENNGDMKQIGRQSTVPALALLRSMSQFDWKIYDDIEEDEGNYNEEDQNENQGEEMDGSGSKDTPEMDGATNEGSIGDDRVDVSAEYQLNSDLGEFGDIVSSVEFLSDLQDLLAMAERGEVDLHTDEYNAVLALFSLSSEIDPDDISLILMRTYHQMKKFGKGGLSGSAPNAETYEILLLALVNRVGSAKTGVDIVRTMLKDLSEWTPEAMVAAIRVLENRNMLSDGMDILKCVVCQDNRSFRIPLRFFHSLINIAKDVDEQSQSIEIVRSCLKESRKQTDQGIDGVVVNAVSWPATNKRGQKVDTTPFLVELLALLEERHVYNPGFKVWMHFVKVAAQGAAQNEGRWKLVQHSFKNLALTKPSFWPNQELLNHGLNASESLGDSSLAGDLILRSLDKQQKTMSSISKDNSSSQTPVYPAMRISAKDILRGIEICVNNGDTSTGRTILDRCNDLRDRIPPPIFHRLYNTLLKGYSVGGETGFAKKLLQEMGDIPIRISDHDCGAVMHGFAVSGDYLGATAFLSSMKAAEFGVAPGPASYGGYILCCVRSHAWEDALAAYDEMKLAGIASSAAISHGLVLSAFHSGGRQRVEQLLKDLVNHSDSKVSEKTCILALSILVPEIGAGKDVPLRTIQQNIREYGTATGNESALDLCKSLRLAELEQHRTAKHSLEEWKTVLNLTLSVSLASHYSE